MFVGHLAVALAAKKRTPRVSLGVLMAATAFIDLIWPPLLLLGLERARIDPGNTAFTPLAFDSYPWSHSLAMVLVWGALVGLAAGRYYKDRASGVVVGGVVVSHWFLDAISHRPDMPLWPGGPVVGLGLWNSIPLTLVVEGAMWAAGLAIYLRATRPADRAGQVIFWSLVVLCTVMWATGPWSPPPPSVEALSKFAFGAWLLPLWAGWADAHRRPRSAAVAPAA
ncbi:MAG TPA: hypothetical protein VFD06_02075 [Candidatus Polarisedimenticolia bacterium]|nr:hypothetical protein [Candidatus Polarisedimenticolia bacterium]